MKTTKVLLTVSLLIMCSIVGFSQQDKGYVALSLGSSIPIGDFARTNYNNKNTAGYANTGILADLSLGVKFSKYFGISMLIRGQLNKTDAQAYVDQLRKEIPTASKISVNTDSWMLSGYMGGLYGTFPVSKKISLETKAMFGFLTAQSPNIMINITESGDSFWLKQHTASATAFSYLLGLGYKINTGKHFCIAVNIDYLGSNPEFNTLTTSSDGSRDKGVWNQKIGTINFGFGVGYRFGTQKEISN